MNVKVFPLVDPKSLEGFINDWLKENPNIHIEYVTQSQIQHGQAMSMPITVCIWYTK